MDIVVCNVCENRGVTIRNLLSHKVCESCYKKLTKGQYVTELSGEKNLYGYAITRSKPTGRNIFIKDGKLVAINVADMERK